MGKRILVTGSLKWTDPPALASVLAEWRAPGATLIHAGARGVERMADAIWRGWGLAAEVHQRFQEMIRAGADVCLVFILNEPDDASHRAAAAEAAGIPAWRYHLYDHLYEQAIPSELHAGLQRQPATTHRAESVTPPGGHTFDRTAEGSVSRITELHPGIDHRVPGSDVEGNKSTETKQEAGKRDEDTGIGGG